MQDTLTHDLLLQLDQYSIFDLMDLHDLTDQKKQTLLLEINSLVWADFSTQRLPYILTQDQMKQVSQALDRDQPFEVVVQQIVSYVPNFPDLLAEYTRLFKADYIKNHLEKSIKDCENFMASNVNSDNLNELRLKREKYVRGLELFFDGNWALLAELFSSSK